MSFACPKCGATSGGDWSQCAGACPMPMSPHHVPSCAHGRKIGGSQLPEGAWFGGVAKCQCCQQTYGYIDSSSFGADGLITSKTMNKTLCRACGGEVTRYMHPDYECVELSPHVFTVRKKTS